MHLLIDGNNLAARCHYINEAGHYLSRSDGTKTGVPYVGLRSVKSLIDKFEAKSVIVVFDKGVSAQRREICPEYKANRRQDQTEEEKQNFFEYINQIKRMEEYFRTLGFLVLRLDKTEADDIIAYFVEKFKEKISQYILVSTDTDFIQLLQYGLKIYHPTKEILLTDDYIKERFGVEKEQFLFYKSMLGDKTDNIDGVKGFGEKAAISLLPVEKLEDLKEKAIPHLKKKKFQDFVNNFSVIERNYKLINLQNVLLPDESKQEIDKLLEIQPEKDKERFNQFCKEDEFSMDWDYFYQDENFTRNEVIDALFD